MANISQKVTSYVHGISQQPDHLKKPGQVRNLLNALPDVTAGLMKRPGSEVISFLDTVPVGKWFTIFRDNEEKYLGLISEAGLRIWSLVDGLPRLVRYNSTPNLEYPEDGGVGIPPPPGTAPGTPPGSNPPSIPAGCDLPAMQAALDAWLKQKATVTSLETQLTVATSTLQSYQAGLSRYVAAQWTGEGVKLALQKGFGVKISGNIPYSTVSGTNNEPNVRIAERRSHDVEFPRTYTTQPGGSGSGNWPVVSSGTFETRGYYTNGVFTQAQVDAQQALVNTLSSQLVTARQALQPVQKAYEREAVKCGVVSLPGTLSLYTTSPIPYLSKAEAQDIDVVTINDYTIITNKNMTVLMGGDKSTARPHEAFLEVKSLEYNTEYWLDVFYPGATQDKPISYATSLVIDRVNWDHDDGTCPFVDQQDFTINSGDKQNLRFTVDVRGTPTPNGSYDYNCRYYTHVTLINGGQNWRKGDVVQVSMKGITYNVTVASDSVKYVYNNSLSISPYLTPKDQTTGILKVDSILDHFKSQIEQNFGWFCTRIGNGLYIEGPKKFSAAVSAGRSEQAMTIMTNSVNNVSKLPTQCKDGYVVKVVNSGNDEDDYYLRFIGTDNGLDGAGVWEETIAPNININLNYNSMPHQIVRMPDGSFMVSPIDWERRLVGDDKTNPEPSFVNKTINKVIFYRNRLGLLSDENVILSRAGDFFNFFVKTALSVSDSDPIDIACSSTTPCVLHNAVGMAPGLVLFSQDKQFLFGTTQDILSPKTAKVDTISTYECDTTSPVLDMGTTIGFVTSSGKNSRFQEMSTIAQGKGTEVIEQSKIVQELLPAHLDLISGSKDDDIVCFAKSHTRDVHFYKYFNDGEKRILSSWYSWSCPGDLIYHAIGRYNYYAVYSIDGRLYLTKTPTHINSEDLVVAYRTPASYSPHLDVKHTVKAGEITFDKQSRTSKFKVWYPYTVDAVVFNAGDTLHQGGVTKVKTVTEVSDGWEVTVDGNWSGYDLQIGYNYTMSVDLPHFYFTQENESQVKTDTRMYLTLHRAKLQLGKVGLIDITVNRKGKQNTELQYEASPADDYDADTHEVLPTTIYQVPIYEKNSNTNITLSSTYPTPCTLLSIEWEGKISTKSYKSV
jgi:hypothetical protein